MSICLRWTQREGDDKGEKSVNECEEHEACCQPHLQQYQRALCADPVGEHTDRYSCDQARHTAQGDSDAYLHGTQTNVHDEKQGRPGEVHASAGGVQQ
jgi:hypothetical protein